MEILISIISFLFLLSVIVLSHEYGHFLAARRQGIRVEKFAFGFGPPLLRYRLKETELLICALPLGGYVKMAGDNRAEISRQPDEFYSKSIGARAAVVVSGPLANFVLAVLIFWLLFIAGYPVAQPSVGRVAAYQPVARSELSPETIQCLEENQAAASDEQMVYLTVSGEDELREKLSSCSPNEVQAVIELCRSIPYPAYSAGVREGDRISEVNGKAVQTWESAAALIRESSGQTVLTIYRDNERRVIDVIPAQRRIKEFAWQVRPPFFTIEERQISYIGIEPKYEEVRFNPFTAFGKSLKKVGAIVALLFKGILFTIAGVVPFKEAFSGPVGIFKIGGEVAKLGLIPFFDFIGVLSVSLGVINLFPLPVLDGGHLTFMGLEKVRGRPLSEKWENIITNVGLGLLIALMVLVLYNDIVRFILKK